MIPTDSGKKPYDVAISFAGEDRPIALQLFESLQARNISVFYDFNEQANLWGKDLIEQLTNVYSNQARFCLMLISKFYPGKSWTRIERQSAQTRASRQPEEYILPIRLDDTEIPGLLSTISFLDLRQQSVDEIADRVAEKLSYTKENHRQESSNTSGRGATSSYNIPLPEIPISYTQLDKDRFIEKAFLIVKDYFRQALVDLQVHYPHIETDVKEINPVKFTARIYVQGNLINMCKIWQGNSFGTQAIQYIEGTRIDIGNDNTMNGYLTVDVTASGLGLKISPLALGIEINKPGQEVVAPELASEYLWKRFTSNL